MRQAILLKFPQIWKERKGAPDIFTPLSHFQ